MLLEFAREVRHDPSPPPKVKRDVRFIILSIIANSSFKAWREQDSQDLRWLRQSETAGKRFEAETRPIAISPVLRVFSDGQTDRLTNRPSDKWLIELRARD